MNSQITFDSFQKCILHSDEFTEPMEMFKANATQAWELAASERERV
jgi:hypothetical protein